MISRGQVAKRAPSHVPQVVASFGDLKLELSLQTFHKLFEIGLLEHLPQLAVCELAERVQVHSQAACEQHRVLFEAAKSDWFAEELETETGQYLRYDGQVLAQIVQTHCLDVDAVDGDRALRVVVQYSEQTQAQTRLASACASHDADLLACSDAHVQVGENGLELLSVLDAVVVELEAASAWPLRQVEAVSSWAVERPRRLVRHVVAVLADTLHRCDISLEIGQLPDYPTQLIIYLKKNTTLQYPT